MQSVIVVSESSQRRCTGRVHPGIDQFASRTSGVWERESCEGMDIYWRDHLVCPSETEYKQMISDSTDDAEG